MKQYPPTPILILYFDISDIPSDELTFQVDKNFETLKHYKQFGWEIMLIPVKNTSTKIEVAAIDGTFDPIQFEQFKKEIYERIKI